MVLMALAEDLAWAKAWGVAWEWAEDLAWAWAEDLAVVEEWEEDGGKFIN